MSQASENDPEIQRNGFKAIVEAVNLSPQVLEGDPREGAEGDGFFQHHFDPKATWEENLAAFRSWVNQYNQLFAGVEEELDDAIDAVKRPFDDAG